MNEPGLPRNRIRRGLRSDYRVSTQAQSSAEGAKRIPGEVVSFTGQENEGDRAAANILDGRADIGWRARSRPPHTLIVELPGEYLISRLSFDNGEGSFAGTSAREIRVEASVEDLDLGYEEFGTFTSSRAVSPRASGSRARSGHGGYGSRSCPTTATPGPPSGNSAPSDCRRRSSREGPSEDSSSHSPPRCCSTSTSPSSGPTRNRR